MEICTTIGLMFNDPPVTKRDLVIAQKAVEPVNFPSYRAEISDKAKALAVKLSEASKQKVKTESDISSQK